MHDFIIFRQHNGLDSNKKVYYDECVDLNETFPTEMIHPQDQQDGLSVFKDI